MAKVFTPIALSSIVEGVRWGQTWLWDIKFDTAPTPFNDWFPAYECDRTLASLNPFSFQGGPGEFRVPMSFGAKDLNLSFYDNDQAVLETWLDTWINQFIFNDFYSVRTLSEISRTVFLAQLDSSKTLVRTHELLVFPLGEVRTMRNSQAGATMLVVSFAIAGRRFTDA